jgi:hypothetical protein
MFDLSYMFVENWDYFYENWDFYTHICWVADYFFVIVKPNGNLIPARNQTGTGMGTNFYLWVRVWVWISTRDLFSRRVIALPNPNPIHCHPCTIVLFLLLLPPPSVHCCPTSTPHQSFHKQEKWECASTMIISPNTSPSVTSRTGWILTFPHHHEQCCPNSLVAEFTVSGETFTAFFLLEQLRVKEHHSNPFLPHHQRPGWLYIAAPPTMAAASLSIAWLNPPLLLILQHRAEGKPRGALDARILHLVVSLTRICRHAAVAGENRLHHVTPPPWWDPSPSTLPSEFPMMR